MASKTNRNFKSLGNKRQFTKIMLSRRKEDLNIHEENLQKYKNKKWKVNFVDDFWAPPKIIK
jgi:hypothetical protein